MKNPLQWRRNMIGGLLGAKEQGYELGSAACVAIMGVAILLNQKLRQSNSNRNRNRNRNSV
jgi:hypothetical protein